MTAGKGWTVTTHKQIAGWMKVSERTVTRTVAALQDKQVLEVVRPVKTHPGSLTKFAIHKQACCY
jgi:Mn-dependent DtxR family transcriptional regulator